MARRILTVDRYMEIKRRLTEGRGVRDVGFYFGAILRDPSRLLEGTGRYICHVKVCPGAFVRDAQLQQLMRDAYADITISLAAR